MTRPTQIYFGPDGLAFESSKNKVHLRTLLYSSSKRGQVLESLHISLHRGETKQNFNIWIYGSSKGELHRGSGLFIPQEGITFSHHFLLPEDGSNFIFSAGNYKLSVFAKLVGETKPHEIYCVNLLITETLADSLKKKNNGLFFDWGADQQSYIPSIHVKSKPSPDDLIELMAKF
jgi:hypothetical protein